MGFEPTVPIARYDDLANRSFRPLRHLSIAVNVASLAQRATYILGVGLCISQWATCCMYQFAAVVMIYLDRMCCAAMAEADGLFQALKELFEHGEHAAAPDVSLNPVCVLLFHAVI